MKIDVSANYPNILDRKQQRNLAHFLTTLDSVALARVLAYVLNASLSARQRHRVNEVIMGYGNEGK